ncbi:chromosome segregation protein SMC [Sporichthya polymorpha]|uniref:chromosome segregation protein SMC n=1 Tax=Sporichthya polymorpha TaxID=35751 RepID=UPI0003607D9A|nr:chromosome segregation protein SMC [Sporichthya polymorpha]
MYLKTLTIKGFKSFASATTLRLEPGITCVVGPNGSGKSNVVDALSWVMGEQGAKSLRGGKMEDVIFAGTSGRPPLGRAEVALTIDNSDGALPIDYTEVTISRTLFRNGGSEYAINGDSCRLLDIQELLSDSGIGREMHVIVGQGQLDAVLSADAEARRGFIEEAAGVLKHRKRKEKALRKLEAMQANLTRVSDLITELRRQLKPLGKQAEVARRAAVVQADLRDARLRLLADDLITLRSSLEAEVADETALRARQAEVEEALSTGRAEEARLETALAEAAPAFTRAQETWYRLSALRERLRGTAGLAAERARHLAAEPEEARGGRDPEDLEREAAQVRAQEAELRDHVEAARQTLAQSVATRQEHEQALATEEKRLAAVVRAAADRREGLARLQGKVNAIRSRASAAEAELGRLAEALEGARARAETARAELTSLEQAAAGLDEGEVGLDEAYEAAADALAAAEEQVTALQAREREVERERTGLVARKETLELGLARRDGAAVVLGADGLPGVLGSVAALLTVEAGYETAVAAALAGVADAVAVESVDAAVAALQHLKEADGGQADFVVGGAPADSLERPALPAGARYVLDVIRAPEALAGALVGMVGTCVAVDTLEDARALVAAHPRLRAVTRSGDTLGADRARGGSASAPSLLEIQAAVDALAQQIEELDRAAAQLGTDLAAAREAKTAAAAAEQAALSRLHESDASMAAVAEQLGQLGAAVRSAEAEAERLAASIRKAEESRDADQAGLAELEARLAEAEREPDEGDDDPTERERLAAACTTARQAEMDSRLALRTGEERQRALSGRAESLARAAQQERAARERAERRRVERERGARVARAVMIAAEHSLAMLETSLTAAGAERDAADRRRTAAETALAAQRGSIRELATELERLTDSVHRDEVARAEHRMRIEVLENRALEELGVAPDILVAEYGPDQSVPVFPEPGPDGQLPPMDENTPLQTIPYVREEQEKRLRAAERALALLGKVNPLALEEFAALEERHQFLSEQLEDLKNSRRDLLTVIKEVDDRVQQVFAEAYADVAREFEGVFSRLFPGGEGRLLLTDPDDMLTTGVEVEARPPGKKVKRLSLLSGGERSLVAVALLVSIFKARPSPFYVLDEVEAALDDTNLGRLIQIMEELRDNSQLIVITHQKRTMEVADALYGVSMRGDGVTTVISQRLREEQPA